MYYVIIIIQLLNVINYHSILSYQTNELIRNTMPLNRLKRIIDYSHSNLDHSILSNTINIFYRIRADRKGLMTCEVNIKEIDFSHSNKNIHNQTQFINESMIEMKPTSTVYLICPQLSTSICYMDCSPNCLLNENGCTIPRSIAQVIEGCQFKRINASTFQYQYIINMEQLDHTGLWNCEYRGQRAVRSLELQAAETFPTNISDASNNPDKNITSSNNDIQIKNGLLKQNRTDIINQSHRNIKSQSKFNKINSITTKSEMTENRKNPNNFDEVTMETMHQNNLMNLTEELKNDTMDKKYIRLAQKQESQRLLDFKLTRPELVLSLIGILAISLIVNIILIIRCLLLKSYLDDAQHGKVNSYLKCVLCIQTKSNLNMSTSMNKSLNVSNHQPLLMTSCHVGQIIEPNTTFMNYSTQIDDSLTESVLLYHNKSGHYTQNENNHLLPPINSNMMLPNLFQSTTSILPLSTTHNTNVSYKSTTPTFHHLISNSSTMNPDDLFKYHKQNGQSSSGVSLESDPTSIKRTNLFHSQSVNYSKQSNYHHHHNHPLLSECCFQNGSITITGQNGSLNGSLLYSNDSTSLTDTTNGNGVIIPNHIIVSPNPYSTYRMQHLCTGEQSDKLTRKVDLQQQSKQYHPFTQSNSNTNSIYQRSTSQSTQEKDRQSCTNIELSHSNNIENDETCHLITEKRTHQDLTNYTFRNSSTIDSLSQDTTNQSINQLSSCLTPLIVRFPSGESGFLFCPTHTTINEHYQTDSLSSYQSNRLSMISNPIHKSINIDLKENDTLLNSNIKINTNCIQGNLEGNLKLENSIESNQLFKTNQHLISLEIDNNNNNNNNNDNHEKLNTLKNSNNSLINSETSLIKSNEKLEIINIQTSLHNNNNIHRNCEFHQFNDSSNDRLHNQNDIQELNINPTIYPVH